MAEMIRELVRDEIAIKLDLSQQVLHLDAPGDMRDREPELSPVPQASSSLVSASVLSQKAKQFDDALYAAVETAVQSGFGNVTSKLDLLRGWADGACSAREFGEAACLLFAACELGGALLPLPRDVSARVQDVIKTFLADEARSAPLGFYSQSERLATIFRQDRLLMTELHDTKSADALASLLSGHGDLLRAYKTILAVASKMTNPPRAELQDLVGQGEAAKRCIFEPSRSHEADLVLRLYGNRTIPSGLDLAEELANRVAAGSLSLAPREDSGWYDHQTWALEPLVAPDRARESTRTRFSPDYRRHLRELFKGLLALTRETHVKQLELVASGALLQDGPAPILIRPELTVEPLARYYARRARSYRFVRGVLQELFGTGWGDLAFTDIPGAWKLVKEGIEAMEALFHGAHVRACRELGLEDDTALLPDRNPDADDASFRAWAGEIARDPDLSCDTRMMVPVFYDIGRAQKKIWALLGWSDRPLTVSFQQPPRVLGAGRKQPAGRLEELRRRFRKPQEDEVIPPIDFAPAYHRVAFPVAVELYVNRLLDRDAFRQLCDKFKTRSAIVKELTGRA